MGLNVDRLLKEPRRAPIQMIDRRLVQNFDWKLLFLVLAVTAIGLLNLYSAAEVGDGAASTGIFFRQLYWIGIGIFAMVLMFLPDYRIFENMAYTVYWIVVALLVAVLIFGAPVKGSQRWIAVGFIQFQPSELAKLALVIALARFFNRNRVQGAFTLVDLVKPILLISIPLILILVEPDLGTTMVLIAIAGTMLLAVRIRIRSILFVTGVGALAFVLAWFWVLQPYQKSRITTFLNPEADPLNAGYQAIQSKIAVGSGELLGRGYREGTQSRLDFLPEKHTDFAFSVLAEEWGFIGATVALLLLALLVLLGLNCAQTSKEGFGTYLGIGIASFLFWPMAINLAMTLGFLPVVGVPLPFLSYGGTALVTNFAALGLLLNVSMRRYIF